MDITRTGTRECWDILAVAETGSLRAASRKIGIAQPTITRSIRDTENELGLTLFTRTPTGALPTKMGDIFIRRATAIQNELRKINEELAQARGELAGQISIAMSAAAGTVILPAILKNLERKYPLAALNLTETLLEPIKPALLAGAVDFYVGPYIADMMSAPLQAELLFKAQRVIVCRKGHPLAKATNLEMLCDARWVRPYFLLQWDETEFEAIFEREGLPAPNVSVQTRSTLMTLMTVISSDLLTIVPLQWLDFAEHGLGIEIIPVREKLEAPSICMIRRGGLPLTPLAEAFYDMVQKAGHNYKLLLDNKLAKLGVS